MLLKAEAEQAYVFDYLGQHLTFPRGLAEQCSTETKRPHALTPAPVPSIFLRRLSPCRLVQEPLVFISTKQ